jgi:hypothetical protein
LWGSQIISQDDKQKVFTACKSLQIVSVFKPAVLSVVRNDKQEITMFTIKSKLLEFLKPIALLLVMLRNEATDYFIKENFGLCNDTCMMLNRISERCSS